MSHYHLVLFRITSWRRRSKKSKEITLSINKSKSNVINFSKEFFSKVLWKQRNTLNHGFEKKKGIHLYIYLFILSTWLVLNHDPFFLSNVDIFDMLNISQKKFNFLFQMKLTSNIVIFAFQWIYKENCSLGTVFL